jgi:hypothetical protein
MGHTISTDGVGMDSEKVQAVREWPTPRSVHALRRFLGLAGYYCKFVCDYGTIAAPLTKLFKKESFAWSLEADTAFHPKRCIGYGSYSRVT